MNDLTEQWSVMQKMFQPFSATLQESARRFWENQDKVLDGMQALASSWFERRHAGTRAARQAAERMCASETGTGPFSAYQEWANGAFERMMADGLSCQQQIMLASGVFAAPPLAPLSGEKEVEPLRSETKAPARTKTS